MKDASQPRTTLPFSLTRFLIEGQRKQRHVNANLRVLIKVVARACKSISIAVGKTALGDVPGSSNEIERVTQSYRVAAQD